MKPVREIEHMGVVEEIDNDTIKVNITSISACQSCHAKGACSVADVQEKTIEIPSKVNYKPGQQVKITLQQSSGYKALFLGYVLPFLIVLFTLILFTSFTDNEAIAGIVSIGTLIPYYSFIYLMRNRIKSKFSFTIKPAG